MLILGGTGFLSRAIVLEAVVRIGKRAVVGAGTTVTQDVPDGALALSRSPQINKPGWAARRKGRNSG